MGTSVQELKHRIHAPAAHPRQKRLIKYSMLNNLKIQYVIAV